MGKVLKLAVRALPSAIIAGITGGLPFFGAALVAGTVSGLLMKQPKMDLGEHGANLRLKTDPAAPRQIIYGRVATGGTLVYRETAGAENINLHLVIALATHEIESVEGMDWAGEAVNFAGGVAQGEFNNKMYLTNHLGAEDQVADSDLVADCPQWTSAHRLRGLAYIHLRLIYDTEVYKQGLQQTRFYVRGRKIYDPRLDSSNGGTGVHRLADTTTWEWSDNPALIAADYLMGLTLNGKAVAGMGVDPARIDWGSVSAQANICDEPVTLKASGSEKRYTCNGIINSARRHGDNLGQIASAMGGNIVFQSGKWRMFAAASRPAVLGRDKQQIIGGIALTAQKGWSEKVNAIRGVYPDADVSYEAKDYPPIVDAGFVTADGGQELWMDLSLPMTTSKTMAQRLAKIALKRARMEKKTTITLTPDALQDQCMDVVNLTYLPFNIDGQKMLVSDWALKFDADKDGNVGVLCQETLVQEDDSIYDWDELVDEQDVLTPTKANPLALNSWKGSDLKYDGGASFESLKPAQIGADVTGSNIANDTANVNGMAAGTVQSYADRAGVGLDGSGDLSRNITSARRNSSNLLGYNGGGSFTGELLADVTGNHTSDDTNKVNGVAAATVQGRADNGYNLTIDGGEIIHKSSILNVDLGLGIANGESVLASLTAAHNVDGYDVDTFGDTSNWTPANANGSVAVSGGAMTFTQDVSQVYAAVSWKNPIVGNRWERISFELEAMSLSEMGFQIGSVYCRVLGSVWQAPSGSSGGAALQYGAHVITFYPNGTWTWTQNGEVIKANYPFTSGVFAFRGDSNAGAYVRISNFKHQKGPLASEVHTGLAAGLDEGGVILRGNPHPTENMLDHDAKNEFTGTSTNFHSYLVGSIGGTGDLDRLGLVAGDTVTIACDAKHSIGGVGNSAGFTAYQYNSSGGYISGSGVSSSTTSTIYTRIFRGMTLHADCAAIKVFAREWASGVASVKNMTLTRGVAQIPWLEPALRENRDFLNSPASLLNPVTAVGIRATFDQDPLSGTSTTVNFASCTMYAGGLSLALGSAGVTGLTASTPYYIYLVMPTLASGTYGLYAATSLNDIGNSNTKVFVGAYTTPSSGSSSGSSPPPDECVSVDAFLPSGQNAGDVKAGDALTLLNTETMDGFEAGTVLGFKRAWAECVTITTATGIELTCSITTPMTLRDGRVLLSPLDVLGEELAVMDGDGFRWEEVTNLEEVGVKEVARISAGGATYAAGDTPERFIFTHNLPKP